MNYKRKCHTNIYFKTVQNDSKIHNKPNKNFEFFELDIKIISIP